MTTASYRGEPRHQSPGAILLMLATLMTLPAFAQKFPSRPVRLIVPYRPAGRTIPSRAYSRRD